jgi:RNA-directed DNA polymerase
MRPLEGKMPGTPGPDPISTRRQRIAELATRSPQAAFTTLAHHIDIDWLTVAYLRTRKDGAVGVDGQTAEDYAADLEGNLRSLLDRAKSGRYQAPPVRRVHIPKGTGPETRPIGIPTFEDKILQRAVAMVLEAVYEQDFLDCSYGFRPGRSAHQALDALWHQLMGVRGGWVLEIDIRKFFDALDHRHLHAILRRRVRDGVLLRLIGKWLKAGVLEDGCITHPESGSPQGGVVTPPTMLRTTLLGAPFKRGLTRYTMRTSCSSISTFFTKARTTSRRVSQSGSCNSCETCLANSSN